MYIILLMIIAGIANAIMDRIKCASNIKNSIFANFNNKFIENWFYTKNSWKNKWKLDKNKKVIKNKSRKWYYLWLVKPSYVERFPYSSTLLVSTTDAWHFFQRLWILSFTIAIILYGIIGMWDYTLWIIPNWVINFVLIAIVYRLSFTIGYKILSKR